MTQKIPLTCPTDHYRWEIEYAQLQRYRVIYKDATSHRRREEYQVTCPQCGTVFIKLLDIEERGG